MAEPAGLDAHQNLVLAGPGPGDLFDHNRPTGLVQTSRLHRAKTYQIGLTVHNRRGTLITISSGQDGA